MAERLPKVGKFSGSYMCSPEDRKFDIRKGFAEKYGHYHTENITEDNVKWVTGLTEVPADVLDLLEYFLSRVESVGQAFTMIDGEDGNGVITLRELEDGLVEMGCHKFNNCTEKDKIANIFRYLDAGGEGSVSREEWNILGQLWDELHLCIKEFVQFLEYAFGPELEDAWAELDSDGGGELTVEEWLQAVETIGYFGPAKSVFALLDSSDDGSISWEEFQMLETYQTSKKDQAKEDEKDT